MSINHQVLDFSTNSSSSDHDFVKDIVAKLKKQGQLSVETVGQILNATSDNLNSQSSNAEQQKVTALSLKMHLISARKPIWEFIILVVHKRFVIWFVCQSSVNYCSKYWQLQWKQFQLPLH